MVLLMVGMKQKKEDPNLLTNLKNKKMEINQIENLEILSSEDLLSVEGGNLLYDIGKAVGNWAWDTLKDVAEGKQTLQHSGAGYILR